MTLAAEQDLSLERTALKLDLTLAHQIKNLTAKLKTFVHAILLLMPGDSALSICPKNICSHYKAYWHASKLYNDYKYSSYKQAKNESVTPMTQLMPT